MGIAEILRRPSSAGVAAFVVGAIVALGTARLVEHAWQRAAETRFSQRAAHITASLRQRLLASDAVLDGARGVLAVSPSLTEDAWRRYVAHLNLDNALVPVRSLGFIAAQGTAAAPSAGLNLLAPLGTTPRALARNETALVRATDNDDVALVASTPRPDAADIPPTITLYAPVYRGGEPATAAARRANLTGFAVASLDPQRLFERESADERNIGIDVHIDGVPRSLFTSSYVSDEAIAPSPLLQRTDTLPFGGTTLTLSYTANGAPAATGAQGVAAAVLAAGMAGAAAFGFAVFGWARSRASRPELAGSGKLNEARLMGVIRSSMDAIIMTDETQKVLVFNPMAEQMFGVSAMEAIGGPLSRFIPARFREMHARHVEQFGVTGVSERQMGRQRVLFGLRGNGEEFPIEASISQIHDGSGKLYTVMLRDVTERLRGENALRQSREELRELSANLQNVREEEKTRIARELHDDLGQQLTALKMDLSAIEYALMMSQQPRGTPEIQNQLHGMHRLIDSTVASVRRIAADLRPVMLDDLGLVPAIEWLTNDFTNRYGIEIARTVDPGGITFTNASGTAVFRIVQEALTNVARHADATLVKVSLRIESGFCVLRIADNGHGAAQKDGAPSPDDKSFGLIGIRERAHMLGGTVTIDTAQGKGFAITVALPLQSVQLEESQS